MSPHNEEARAKALAYLKDRGIYILDGKFKPTGPASTDVAKTMARYRQAVLMGKKPTKLICFPQDREAARSVC